MSMHNKPPLVILTGPTAVGKTKLSIALAKAVNGEIICADSMQVYKHMDIGSAKVTQEEMQGIPHYMTDLLEPTQDFNVVAFQQYAKKYLEKIYRHGKLPILVGGTGFYIQALLYDIDFTENEEDSAYREALEELARTQGAEKLHDMLRAVDSLSARQIHPNNVKRVIRALEYHHLTGEKISEHNEKQRQKEAYYNTCYFVLNDERRILYERIDRRVDAMLEAGLLEEVRALQAMGCKIDSVSMQGLGYKELLAYLDGKITLEEAVYLIKRDTRHFAKRQLTWFRREQDVIWIERQAYGQDEGRMLDAMLQIIAEKLDWTGG